MRALISTLLLIGLFILLQGCLQTENSSSLDPYLIGTDHIRGIFSQRCNGCHHGFHSQSDDELIASGLVVPGSPETSPVYYRLMGSEGPHGPKDMPSLGSIDPEEVEQIKNWIQNL